MVAQDMEIGYHLPSKWPKLLDMTKDECRKALRALELTTYSQVVSVLRAQGELTKEKKKLLSDLQTMFSISLERHRAEIRRAVNDEKLTTLADTLAGPNTGVEWAIEGRRLVPLMPRVAPQTAYTALATRMALLYYGANAKMPPPASTAHYGKMDDLGAESENTDSEEETDGLRYIPGAMVPPQYNADQGSYTTLPLSKARLAKMPPKENRETPATTAVGGGGGSVSVGPGGGSTSGGGGGGGRGSDKRKRKRSSSEHPLPPPPPPPPPPPTPPAQPSRDIPPSPGTPSKQVTGIGRPLPGPPMKITVTGNVTRGTPGTPVSTLGSHTQKVILVSTSGASGVGGGVYQRSLSVPVMKSGAGTAPTVMRGVSASANTVPATQMQTGGSMGSGNMIVPSTYSSSGLHGAGGMAPAGTYVNRTRPRVPSSTLPSRPRERSKSLVLQADGAGRGGEASGAGGGGGCMASSGHVNTLPSYPGGSPAVVGTPAGSPSLSAGHLMTHQTIQVRPSTGITPAKTAIQIRQEGSTGAKIITHSVGGAGGTGTAGGATSTTSTIITPTSTTGMNVGTGGSGRLVGRTPILPPSSPQGSGAPLYVVTTNSGTITVVTRTVAAGQGTGPRVVTVNTINAPKSSVSSVRTPTPATVVSVGPKTIQTVRVTPQGQGPSGLRPVPGTAKSNVIVVHKGAPPPGTRPMSFQGIRDGPTKITIGKSISSNTGAPVLQKPPAVTRSPIASSVLATPNAPTTQGNVILVDLNPENSNVNNTNALADMLQVSGESQSTSNSGSSITSSITSTSSTSSSSDPSTTTTSITTTTNETTTTPAVTTTTKTTTTPAMSPATTMAATTVTTNTSTTSSSLTTTSSTTSSTNTTSSSTTTTATTTAAAAAPLSASTVVSSSDGGVTMSSSGSGGGGGEGEGEWLNLGLEGEDSPAHSLPEGQMQMLEEAVEILGRGDKESARNLLRQAGIELLDSPGELGEHGAEGTSMASLMAGLASQLPGAHLDEGPLAPVGELDPVTGLFYNPSSSESSSDSNSNSASDELEAPDERESTD
ncbi:mucin-5AC-like isoform X2 [Eriocheir sinensis]|uniref:mucin-5AC-like isoform X2 n=1 Tax=Eriocheir sinensis TaxID=95602 RepID=UPI0021C5AF22|nr:mucin-5AC-like isoform X2 [Eriocheir sinensis]